MSLSHRSSARRVEPDQNHEVRGGGQVNSGADGSRHPESQLPGRYGRRQLEALKTQLSERELAVIRSLGQLHYLTGSQLERLHFTGHHPTQLATTKATRRALLRLYQRAAIDRLDRRIGGVRAGSSGYVFSLSPIGARILATDSRRRSREPSLLHLAHVLAVADLAVRLVEAEREGLIDGLAIEAEPDCWRPYVTSHGARAVLKSDLRLTISRGDQELHWFVEVDRGSEHRAALIRKCAAYLAAWREGSETARAGVFPRVLWAVPEPRRAQAVNRVVEGLPGVPVGLFVVAVEDDAVQVLAGLEAGS